MVTGCPNCNTPLDPPQITAGSCPNCRSPLTRCTSGCPFLIAAHADPDCSARGYACRPAGREVFRSEQMILHHHLPA